MGKINNRTRHGFQDKDQFKYFLRLKKEFKYSPEKIAEIMKLEDHIEFIKEAFGSHNKFCEEKKEEFKQEREDAKERRNVFYELEITKETEKAVCSKIILEHVDLEETIEKSFWVPKSVLKDNKCPGWFLFKKITEVVTTTKGACQWFGASSYERMVDVKIADALFAA